jgi:hypothetical protein
LLYAGFKVPRGAAVPIAADYQPQNNGGSSRREALVRAIAALDEKFQQGQIPESDYQAQRQQLKARLLAASQPNF